MISKVKTLWNNGSSLYNGGTQHIENIVEANGFIVYQVEIKTCNRGGKRNSGITMWQGTRAFNGEIDLEIKPLALWRDGENQCNDHPESRFFIEEVRDNQVVLRCHNGDREIFALDFSKKKAKLLKRVKEVDWLIKAAKSRNDLIYVLKSCVHQILDQRNPRGSNTIWSRWEKGDDIIFFAQECLYGDPYQWTLFKGKIGEKFVHEFNSSGRFSRSPYRLLEKWEREITKKGFVRVYYE